MYDNNIPLSTDGIEQPDIAEYGVWNNDYNVTKLSNNQNSKLNIFK